MKIQTKYVPIIAALLLPPFSAHAKEATVNTISGLQLATGDCIVAKQEGAHDVNTKNALDAMASAMSSQGVNYIGKALTAAGAAKTWTITGSRNIQAASENFAKCVQVVRGSFITTGESGGGWNPPKEWPADLAQKLAQKGLRLAAAPDFIFEGQIVASSDKSALSIRPIIASYMTPIDTRWLRPGHDRSIALFFSITPPGTKVTIENSPAATVVLGKFSPDTTLQYQNSSSYSSPYESSWFSLTKADTVKPLTITALLSETQDEQEFLSFMGTVFSDTKVTTAVNTQIGQSLGTSAGQQASLDAASKAVTSANDADSKLALAIAKLNTCKGASDASAAVTAAADARNALRNYMAADKQLIVPANVVSETSIDEIDLQKSKASITAACTNLLATLAKP